MSKAMQVVMVGELEVCWQGPGWYRRSQKRPRYHLVCALREASPQKATWASSPQELMREGEGAA